MKDEERDDHMIIAKIAYCRGVIELVMDEFEESSSLAEQQDAASSALGVDSLETGRTLGRPE